MANEWLSLASAAWLTPSPPATTAGWKTTSTDQSTPVFVVEVEDGIYL